MSSVKKVSKEKVAEKAEELIDVNSLDFSTLCSEELNQLNAMKKLKTPLPTIVAGGKATPKEKSVKSRNDTVLLMLKFERGKLADVQKNLRIKAEGKWDSQTDYANFKIEPDQIASLFGVTVDLDKAGSYMLNGKCFVQGNSLKRPFAELVHEVVVIQTEFDAALPTTNPPIDLKGGKATHTYDTLKSIYHCGTFMDAASPTLLIIDNKMSQSHPWFNGRVTHVNFDYASGTFSYAADYATVSVDSDHTNQHGMMCSACALTVCPTGSILFINRDFEERIGQWEKKLFESLPNDVVVSISYGQPLGIGVTSDMWIYFNSIMAILEQKNILLVCSQGNSMVHQKPRFPSIMDGNFVVGSHCACDPTANGGTPTSANVKYDVHEYPNLVDWPEHPWLFPGNDESIKSEILDYLKRNYLPIYSEGGAPCPTLGIQRNILRPVPDCRGITGKYDNDWCFEYPVAWNGDWKTGVHFGETSGATPQIAMMLAFIKPAIESVIGNGHKMKAWRIARVTRAMANRFFDFDNFFRLYMYCAKHNSFNLPPCPLDQLGRERERGIVGVNNNIVELSVDGTIHKFVTDNIGCLDVQTVINFFGCRPAWLKDRYGSIVPLQLARPGNCYEVSFGPGIKVKYSEENQVKYNTETQLIYDSLQQSEIASFLSQHYRSDSKIKMLKSPAEKLAQHNINTFRDVKNTPDYVWDALPFPLNLKKMLRDHASTVCF